MLLINKVLYMVVFQKNCTSSVVRKSVKKSCSLCSKRVLKKNFKKHCLSNRHINQNKNVPMVITNETWKKIHSNANYYSQQDLSSFCGTTSNNVKPLRGPNKIYNLTNNESLLLQFNINAKQFVDMTLESFVLDSSEYGDDEWINELQQKTSDIDNLYVKLTNMKIYLDDEYILHVQAIPESVYEYVLLK